MDDLKKTCLYDNHVALKAQMSPFGGFMMPIQYSSIIDEHNAVRQRVGMFDVSHMGEIFVTGDDAERFVNHIFTNELHIPCCTIEKEYALGAVGQLRTRFQAFIESLEIKSIQGGK